ncbi:ABC transporter ATP-binding protein [Halobacteriales archaeon Cl-PHB]
MLELDDVYTGYGEIQVLHGIDLEVTEGEIVALIGSNGAGKTTTTRTICGMIPTWDGRITYKGEDITDSEPHEVVEHGIVQVPENRELFVNMTVEDNLLLGAQTDYAKDNRATNLEYAYDLFPRLEERSNQVAGTMSGGEQQMLTIARALMAEPEFLILDEPSIGLAPQLVSEVFDVIQEVQAEQDLTVLIIEQNVQETLTLADRAYVLENGEISIQGDSEDLLDDERVVEAYLGIN